MEVVVQPFTCQLQGSADQANQVGARGDSEQSWTGFGPRQGTQFARGAHDSLDDGACVFRSPGIGAE
ncbi:hypothetical protein D3C77_638510 [compost metagenome]